MQCALSLAYFQFWQSEYVGDVCICALSHAWRHMPVNLERDSDTAMPTARLIVEQGGHELLVIKGNQPMLFQALQE